MLEQEPNAIPFDEEKASQETEEFTPAALAEALTEIFPGEYLLALKEETIFEEALGLAASMANELGITQEQFDKVLQEKGILEPEQTEQTPEQMRRQAIERNQQELARRKEAGEIEPIDYELNYLHYLQKSGEPLTRKDVGSRAVVISQRDLETLGYLEFMNADGEIIVIDPDDTGYEQDDPLIIFPEELGDKKI